jgi:hypothetical protein
VSLLSTRLALTQRCTIERNANADATDDWQTPPPPAWAPHLQEQPCRAWISGHRPVSHEGTLTAVLIELSMLVPLGTDVTDGDRVNGITLRGEPVHEGPLTIHAVLERRDHLELILSKAA